jgi:hypothetical protein
MTDTQPAGEHHTGSLDLTGEGNAPEADLPISMEILGTAWAATTGCPIAEIRAALVAAYPAIRQQVAEEIAAAIAVRRAEITEGRPGWVYLTEAIGIVERGLL